LRFCRTDDRFANTWRSKGGCSWITFPSPRRVPASACLALQRRTERADFRCSDLRGLSDRQCHRRLPVRTILRSCRDLQEVAAKRHRAERQRRPELLRQLHVQMGNLGEDARINRNLQPHATLLYDSEVMPRVTLQKPVVVAAREFVLLRNRPGEHGYEFVDRWPLRREDNGLPRAIEVA